MKSPANAVRIMKENPEIRTKMGRIAREKVLQRHSTEKAFQEFLTILQIS